MEDVPACCSPRRRHAAFLEAVARSWLLMTASATYPLLILPSGKLQQASRRPQGVCAEVLLTHELLGWCLPSQVTLQTILPSSFPL